MRKYYMQQISEINSIPLAYNIYKLETALRIYNLNCNLSVIETLTSNRKQKTR